MDYRYVKVAQKDALQPGEMKEIVINENDEEKILLLNREGIYHAVGCCCTHYGAPLAQGVLHGDKLVCPWHTALFNAKNGDLIEPPAMDPLPNYEVTIEGDDVIVKLPEKLPSSRTAMMSAYHPESDDRTFAIIGAGAAGNMAAQTLREDLYKGRIVMITSESHRPYDRPNLSKGYLQGQMKASWLSLRPTSFYEDHGIELMQEKKVTSLDISKKSITFEDGDTLSYDKVLVASGSSPRTLELPGTKLKNVFTLRSYDDAEQIIESCSKASRAVIVGASFIGIEAAFSLSQRGLKVTVVAPEAVPFEQIFGKEIGTYVQQVHQKDGIDFQLGTTPKSFEGSDAVEAIMLENGQRVETDLVIIGIGVRPNTGFVQRKELLEDGSLKVDAMFHAGKDVYAAGDIATFTDWRSGNPIRIEHWRTAEQQGRIAAHNMLTQNALYDGIPFFWSKQGDLNVKYVGHAPDWDELLTYGDISSGDGLVLYVKDERVLAAAGIGRGKEIGAIHELMCLNNLPHPDELRNNDVDFVALLTK